MNRQIEFRGKRIDNGEWVYGYYIENKCDNHFIYEVELKGNLVWNIYEVAPSTIGQFTGLVDKNGKRIYEGDFIKGKEWERGISHRHIGIVEYIGSSFRSVGINKYLGFHGSVDGSYEVIGNIHTKENK